MGIWESEVNQNLMYILQKLSSWVACALKETGMADTWSSSNSQSKLMHSCNVCCKQPLLFSIWFTTYAIYLFGKFAEMLSKQSFSMPGNSIICKQAFAMFPNPEKLWTKSQQTNSVLDTQNSSIKWKLN